MIPVLRSERLILRGFTWADFAAFAEMWGDPAIAERIPFAPIAPQDLWARFNENVLSWVLKGYGSFVVADNSGVFLGTVSFFQGNPGYGPDYDDAIQAGWVFAKASHGKGIATEAVKMAHGWFDDQEFSGRTVCGMDLDHAASIRVAEKCRYRRLRQMSDEFGGSQLMERVKGL